MPAKIKYNFSGKLWKSDGQGGWFFVTFPKDMSDEIRENLQWQEEGWGRMKAIAKLQDTEWDTSIWFDKKQKRYVLPIKADIRKKASLSIDDVISVDIFL